MSKIASFRRRRRVLLVVAAVCIVIWQLPTIDVLGVIRPGLGLDRVLQIGGLFLAAASVTALAILWRPRDAALRAALDTEAFRAHRRAALISGYWAGIVAGLTVFVLAIFLPIPGTDAALLILISAIVAPMFRLAKLEKSQPAD